MFLSSSHPHSINIQHEEITVVVLQAPLLPIPLLAPAYPAVPCYFCCDSPIFNYRMRACTSAWLGLVTRVASGEPGRGINRGSGLQGHLFPKDGTPEKLKGSVVKCRSLVGSPCKASGCFLGGRDMNSGFKFKGLGLLRVVLGCLSHF